MRSLRGRDIGLVVALLAFSASAASATNAVTVDSGPRVQAAHVVQAVQVTPSAQLHDSVVVSVRAVRANVSSVSTVPAPTRGRTPATQFPIEIAFAALATARKTGGRKSARKTADTRAGIPTPPGGTTTGPPTETVVEPAAGSPLAKKAAERQRDATEARQREAAKAAKRASGSRQQGAAAAGVAEPPNPDDSDNVKATGEFDETVEGGRYLHTDGKYRNAHGEVVK